MQISQPSYIVGIIISAIISIGLPIALFIFLRKKYNAKILPLILGIAGFMIFTFVLEKYVNLLFAVFFIFEKGLLLWIFWILRGIFIVGFFEETARFIAFKILKKKCTGIETALSYGIGYIGINGIIAVGIPIVHTAIYIIENIVTNANIFQGEEVSILPELFLSLNITRISDMCVQMSCSVIVFYSVYGTKKLWLYPLAIMLHAIIEIPIVAFALKIESMNTNTMILMKCINFLYAIVLIVIARYVHKKLKESI